MSACLVRHYQSFVQQLVSVNGFARGSKAVKENIYNLQDFRLRLQLHQVEGDNFKGGNSVYETGPARPVSRRALHGSSVQDGELDNGDYAVDSRGSLFINRPQLGINL